MIGQVIGDIRIERELGRGGMGAVFEGLDLMLERRVAVKVVHPELGQDPVLAERFQKEARALARLNHPNVTSVFRFFRQGGQFYLVMEFVEGESLDERIRSRGALPWPDAADLTCAALDGLQHAHEQSIIHRDVKPSNLLLVPAGGLKIMDFGIAHILGQSRLTRMGSVVGTIEYMSPEQIGGRELDARTDLYSIGVVLYEMVTGRVPFRADTDFELMRAQLESIPQPPRALTAELPEWLEGLILRALAKDPAKRLQTAAELAAALRRGLAESGTATARPAVAETPPPPPAVAIPWSGTASGTPPPDAAGAVLWNVRQTVARFVRPRIIPLASLGLLMIAAVVLGLALFNPAPTVDPRTAAVPPSRRTADVTRVQPPATAPSRSPVTAASPGPEARPAGAMRPRTRPPTATATVPPPPTSSSPPPLASPPPAIEAPAARPKGEASELAEPPAATAEPPRASDEEPPGSADPEALLRQIGPLAEKLQIASNRLSESYEAFEDDEDRWSNASAGRVAQLLQDIDSLEATTDRLQRAYDVVADREGVDSTATRRRFFRKLKAKTTRVTGLNQADYETLWQRAEEAAAAGRRVAELMSQVEIDEPVRDTWRPVQEGLERLERLTRTAKTLR